MGAAHVRAFAAEEPLMLVAGVLDEEGRVMAGEA
jgi:hypothetical protein